MNADKQKQIEALAERTARSVDNHKSGKMGSYLRALYGRSYLAARELGFLGTERDWIRFVLRH